jgi:hypothetical protein
MLWTAPPPARSKMSIKIKRPSVIPTTSVSSFNQASVTNTLCSFNALMMLGVGGPLQFSALLTFVRSAPVFLHQALILPTRFTSDRNNGTIS